MIICAKCKGDSTMTATDTENTHCAKQEPKEEHKWLAKLVGSWTCEADCGMGPDGSPIKTKGKETVRTLDGIWMVAEGVMESPSGEPGLTMMTLGFDPQKGKFIGSWVGSMMTNMWVYEGELDTGKKILTLNTTGPDFVTPGKECKYQDIIEIVSDDHRILKSRALGPDGNWNEFMTVHYNRSK